MKKRIMIAAVLLLLVAALLAGCYAMRKDAEDIKKAVESGAMMATVYVDTILDGCIAYDTETRVMYWISCGVHNRGTATVMVDSNGKPRLWAH